MMIHGLYFNIEDAEKMLAQVEANIPIAERERLMPIVKSVMDDSAGKGFNGEPSCTSTAIVNGYQVTANVCCGGYAEVNIGRVKPVIPII